MKDMKSPTVIWLSADCCKAMLMMMASANAANNCTMGTVPAAATVWRGTPGPDGLKAFEFNTTHLPAERDKLRFEQRDGKLRNLLHRTVPELAAGAVAQLWRERSARPVSRVVAHSGGRDVLEALAPVLEPHSLAASTNILRDYGNMSSPSVLFALAETLKDGPPNGTGDFWLVSFGAGFSAHSCRIGK